MLYPAVQEGEPNCTPKNAPANWSNLFFVP